MKKIVLLLSLVLCAAVSFAQSGYVNTTTTGSATTLFKSKGYLGSDSAFILLLSFSDTTTANYSGASLYNGAFIRVGTSIYYRTLSPKKWNLFATGSIPDQFNPTAGYAITLSGTYPNITFTVDTTLAVPYTDTLKLYGIATKSNVNLKVNISDTSAMLSNLLRKSDTLTMMSGYARTGNVVPNTRTITTNAPLAGGGNLGSDRTFLIDTGRANAEVVTGGSLNKVRDSLQANITASVSGVSNVSGTGALSFTNPTTTPVGTIDTAWSGGLTTRLRTRQIADSLQNNIDAKGTGTVTSIATINGILGGTITTTGTLQVDSSAYSTKAYVLKIASDTSTSLRTLINTKGTGNGTVTSVAAGTGMSFTTITTTGNVNADTSVLSTKAYVLKVASDTSTSLRTLINTKGTGNGTVTSVALSLPSFITVSGSPITTSGTLTGTLANQTANTFFRGPTSGSPAQPVFGVITAADLPDSYLPISDTADMLSHYAYKDLTNITGVLPVTHGGTGVSNLISNYFYKGNGIDTLLLSGLSEDSTGNIKINTVEGNPVLTFNSTGGGTWSPVIFMNANGAGASKIYGNGGTNTLILGFNNTDYVTMNSGGFQLNQNIFINRPLLSNNDYITFNSHSLSSSNPLYTVGMQGGDNYFSISSFDGISVSKPFIINPNMNSIFSGTVNYAINNSSNYTSRSHTDKNYVDSSLLLKLNIYDTASMLSSYKTYYPRNSLSFVAGSGGYNSTTGVITIPTNNSQISNGAGYITAGATYYIGTTLNALNRASASQTLTGVSIDGTAAGETLATVTGRGASTSTAVSLNGGVGSTTGDFTGLLTANGLTSKNTSNPIVNIVGTSASSVSEIYFKRDTFTTVGYLGSGVNSTVTGLGDFVALENRLTSGGIVFRTNGTTALTIDSSQAATFASSVTATSFIKSDGTSSQALIADGSVQSFASGIYTPTLTNVNNVSSITPGQATWTQVGNIVTVHGSFTLTATSALASTTFSVSIPVASASLNPDDVNGVAFFAISGGGYSGITGYAYGNGTSHLPNISFKTDANTSFGGSYEFQYYVH